jgi:hypothetical protein
MNPFELLKAIYESFGTPYPRASLVAVMILGAISFGAVWLFAAKQVEKGHLAGTRGGPAAVSGPASTKGPNSPAVTGNGNDIQYDQSPNPDNKKKTPK